jgi:hypothetical protein
MWLAIFSSVFVFAVIPLWVCWEYKNQKVVSDNHMRRWSMQPGREHQRAMLQAAGYEVSHPPRGLWRADSEWLSRWD